MLFIVNYLVIALHLITLPYLLIILVAALAAITRRRKQPTGNSGSSKFLIVCPAHDEEFNISTTVRSCLAANYPPARLEVLVVADNCADRTAAVAAQSGARVLERLDDARKSKGYALEFLIEQLDRTGELQSVDAIVVIDADTIMDPDLLRLFDQDLHEGRDWVQCYYTVANPDETWRTRLMTYAFSLHNGVMLLAQDSLGIGAGLRGNGMCLSTRGLRRVPWRAYGLVEDLEFTWSLLCAGEQIAFQPGACVRGMIPAAGGKAAASQRRRWESGRSDLTRKYLGPLLHSDRVSLWRKAALAAVLTMPTLTRLAVASVVLAAIDLAVATGTWPGMIDSSVMGWFCRMSLVSMSLAWCLYLASPFVSMGLDWKYAFSLVSAPLYVSWKFLVSLSRRPERWVRTERSWETVEPRAVNDEAVEKRSGRQFPEGGPPGEGVDGHGVNWTSHECQNGHPPSVESSAVVRASER
jgi:cellulose synthase/poly-beta-1,6-N-acetylglucosamine synthase-like glycosyltransferase